MHALQIHLNPQPIAMSGQGANVHGMNAPIRDANSFDSFLQKEINKQTPKATDGSSENRNSVSDSPNSNTTSGSEQVSDKSQTEKSAHTEKETQTEKSAHTEKETQTEKSAHTEKETQTEKSAHVEKEPQTEKSVKSEDSKSSKKISEDDSSSNVSEKDVLPVIENPADILQLQTATEARSALSYGILQGENLQDVSTAVIVGEKLFDDQQAEDKVTDSDEALLAFLSGGSINSTEQVAGNKSFAINAGDDENSKVDGIEASKGSKQVLAEIPTINVQDERTVSAEGKSDGNFVNSVNYDGNGNATIDVSVNPNGANLQNTAGAIINSDGSVQQHTATNAQQFGTMLSSEIQSNSAELVKAGSIVLRDGNKGTINLILHPEELGNVKISLEISDNILNGRITVASEEAFNAFKANLASLRDAFTASGFDTANFDLNWSGQENGQNAQNEQEDQGKNPFGNRYDDNIAIIPDGEEMEGDYNSYHSRAYINVMA